MGVASYPVEEADVSTLLHPPDGGQSSCHVLLSLSPWVVYPLPCSRGMSFQGYCRDLVFFLTEIQEGAHVKHHIRTDDHPKQFAYQASPEKRADIEHLVAGLLADGVVEESCSPLASPVVLVKKDGGQWRFCIDYCHLNSVTIKDLHYLLGVDDRWQWPS